MRRASVITAVLLAATAAAARPTGSLADPFPLAALPFGARGDTRASPHHDAASYSCAPSTSEAGAEYAWRFTLAQPGRVVAWVVGDTTTVDVDVHLLQATGAGAGDPAACVARGNTALEADVAAGTYVVVVDTYQGDARAGPFQLFVDASVLDEWRERTVATGVVWRSKRYASYAGGAQTGNVLEVDLAAPGVRVEAVDAVGCERTSDIRVRVGAVAAVNAGYFDGSCGSVSLLRVAGTLVATNAVGRSALGLPAAGGPPAIQLVAAGADWPGTSHAIGGGPRLVSAGAVDVRNVEEGMTAAGFVGKNPRTVAGLAPAGALLFATIDGRTAAGAGMSLDELATWLTYLGVSEGMNFDGGGSTTLVIGGQPWDGVVNYPSDNGTADHLGERAVGSAWAVFADRFNHPPRWITTPGLDAAVGTPWRYEAAAVDEDADALVYALAAGPAGLTVDTATGDVDWTPAATALAAEAVRLTVSDGTDSVAQEFVLAVAGGVVADGGAAGDGGPAGDGGAGDAAGAADGTGADGPATGATGGCGCRAAPGAPGALGLGLLVLLGARRRARAT
jgi:MYXO-CTERM domain-containing protein